MSAARARATESPPPQHSRMIVAPWVVEACPHAPCSCIGGQQALALLRRAQASHPLRSAPTHTPTHGTGWSSISQ